MDGHRVLLSIGSNMGDKAANCRSALAELERRGLGTLLSVSPFYRTEPVDYLDQDWFVNAAAELGTPLEPLELLDGLKQIQNDLGTDRKAVRFGPRIIDLDILLFDDRVIRSDALTVPHERMHQRAFVLVPVCDIAPDRVHPVTGRTMARLLADLDADHQGVVPFTSTQEGVRHD
ncbi:2-amino-4-hydroxy-6-hydroxymethyldihydropteridine diphosphokinase [Desulfatiferula olefinivorans]